MNNHKKAFWIKKPFHILSLPRRIGMLLVLPLLAVVYSALAQTPDANFDHIKTGFKLTGAHAQARCGSCHIQGVFKGTPRDCASCHKSGNRMGAMTKPGSHIPAAAPCDTCHRTMAWTPATFSHVGVATGACLTCHNGTMAMGKPSGHVSTTASCDSCHKSTTTWAGAGFDHKGVVPGTCATCHNGTTATGKPGGHVSTTASCDSCHKSTTTWAGAGFNHAGVAPGTCATCHNGTTAMGKTSNHIPTTSWPSCDSCHKSTASFANTVLHSLVTVAPGTCATCHNGTTATGKPGGHVSTTASCDSCHKSTTTWAGAGFNHAGVAPGTCATCHNGTTAMGKTSNHIPTTSWPSCDSCHKSTASFANTVLHSSVTVAPGTCATCHNGTAATGKPANHIPLAQLLNGMTMACDACHLSMANWVSEKMNHNNSQGNGSGWCKGCHASGTSYLGSMDKKSVTHKSGSATDCSQSGCHRPLGSKGTTYVKWD